MSMAAFIVLGFIAELAVIWLAYVAGHNAGICED